MVSIDNSDHPYRDNTPMPNAAARTDLIPRHASHTVPTMHSAPAVRIAASGSSVPPVGGQIVLGATGVGEWTSGGAKQEGQPGDGADRGGKHRYDHQPHQGRDAAPGGGGDRRHHGDRERGVGKATTCRRSR